MLAKYKKTNSAAVVECQIQSGKAILTGIHPEYAAEWLNATDPRLKDVIPTLLLNESKRSAFFRSLLESLDMKLLETPQDLIPALTKNYILVSPLDKLEQTRTLLSPLSNKLDFDFCQTNPSGVSFDCALFQKLLKTEQFGRTLMYGEVVNSTQTFLVE